MVLQKHNDKRTIQSKEGFEMTYKIVIADDEKALAETLSYAFKREGYEVYTAFDGREALRLIQSVNPDLAILDVTMPYLTGFEILRQLDPQQKIGLMLLTAKNELVDKVLGLEFGADDYITKPFDMREVLARASSLLRRMNKFGEGLEQKENQMISNQMKQVGRLKVDYQSRMTYLGTSIIELTPKEFDLLWLFMNNPMRVFSREQLLESIWERDYEGGERTVDIHIQRLRKKLEEVGERHIQTVYKVGYKWVGDLNVSTR
jgi:two-component system alkaline phosphatase synthesis response regulator PhoP